MATCPSCEAPDLEVDEYELEEGEIITCPDCGSSLEVTSIAPVELDVVSDDDDDDEEDEDDEDEDEDEDADEGGLDELDEEDDDKKEDWAE
jgi:alpha-aminoadipate/glutamate carrier protein LysW